MTATTDDATLLQRAFSDAVADSGAPGDEEYDAIGERVLAAAAEEFCQIGVRRATMESVARRAGVSRITVYRRFPNKDQLVEHVVRREFRQYFDQFGRDIADAETAADRVVAGFVGSLRAARTNPLIGGLMSVEPDLVVPSMISDGGRTLATVRRFVAAQLRLEQRAGTVAHGLDVDLVAEMLVRVTASFLGIPSEVVDLEDEEQLASVARRFLVPMLETLDN